MTNKALPHFQILTFPTQHNCQKSKKNYHNRMLMYWLFKIVCFHFPLLCLKVIQKHLMLFSLVLFVLPNLALAQASFISNDIATDADNARSVYAIDIDSDGDIDVLSANNTENTVALV